MTGGSSESIGIFSFKEDQVTIGAVTSKLDAMAVDYHFVASEDIINGSAAISLRSPFQASETKTNAWFRKVLPGLVLYPDKPPCDPLNLRGERESMYVLKEYIRLRYRGMVLCDPNRTAPAENKVTQLRVASEVGLDIPKTIFTNSLDDPRSFFGSKSLVYKGISQYDPITNFYGKEADNPTTCIDLESLPGGLLVSPSMFQEEIEKRAEYRVTVVGQEIFVARMAPRKQPTEIDWRDALVKGEISLKGGDLPMAYKAKLLKLVTSMGLNFASLDVIEDGSGRLYFVDLNPNGNWYWVEDATGLDISGAIAGMLAGRW